MTLSEAQASLVRVRAQIESIENGGITSYSINGRQKVAHSLEVLYKREAYLEGIISRLQGGGFYASQFRNAE